MDNMRRLVLLKQLLRLLHVPTPTSAFRIHLTKTAHSPEVRLRRRREHPRLARPLAKARPLGLRLDHVLDRAADEAAPAGDKDDIWHRDDWIVGDVGGRGGET